MKMDVLEAIEKERMFQDEKHGTILKNPHSVAVWLLLMKAEMDEAFHAAIKGGKGRDNVIKEVIQVVALGVACLEQHGVEEVKGRQL